MTKIIDNSDNNVKQRSVGRTIAKIFIRVICAVLGLVVGVSIYFYMMLDDFHVNVPIVTEDEYYTMDKTSEIERNGGDISSSWADGGHTGVYVDPAHPIIKVDKIDKDIQNILVFGVDSRGTDEIQCRSDSMMVLSVNKKNGDIKLVSLMRDTGVYIGDTYSTASSSLDKLTHAYYYGGVGLLINTINRNFGLDIQRFIMFDFNTAADFIDLCGGVTIDVTADEVKYANINITEQSNAIGIDPPLLSGGGVQELSGVQAIGWARIRYLDSDFVRTSRQRTVAMALIDNIRDMSIIDKAGLLHDCSGVFETNMTATELIKVGYRLIRGRGDMEEYRLPADNLYSVQQNPWMMIIDFDAQRAALNEFIWG